MLRTYQQKAVELIQQQFRQGNKKVLLQLATGGGKTVIFSDVMKKTLERKRSVVMMTRGRKLIHQCHERLVRENVPHGVWMAGHKHFFPSQSIQIASIDTLRSRGIFPKADLLVLDEVHYATSKSYHDIISHYPDAYILGVTATPYCEKSLRHVADEIVKPITMDELIEQGFLVKAQYYAPSQVDLSTVKVSASTNDYVVKDLESVMNQNHLVGDLVKHWQKFGENRPTLIFAVSIEHSKHIARIFSDAGINAAHCDADTKDEDRNRIIKDFETGLIKVITNVGIFCTGVDIPAIECIVMARPTKSYNLYIQQAGRGTRICGDKKDFLLIDHAGNIYKHGFINEEPEANLDGKEKSDTPPIKTCEVCFTVCSQFEKKCPKCGTIFVAPEPEEKPRTFEHIDGELERIESLPILVQAKLEYKRLQNVQKEKQYKRGWIYYRLKEKYGEEIAQTVMPRKQIPAFVFDKIRDMFV